MRISDWSSDVCSSDLASIFSWVDQPILMRSGTGMPATVEYSTTGTIVSPWPPSTKAVTSSTETSNSSARKRSEEHTSELQSLMRISYAVFCLKKKKNNI